MNFTQYVFENSKELKNKTAIFHMQNTIIYSELVSLILKISHKLDSLDLKSDEKIIIVSDNSFFFIAAYFGIIASGRVVVPLHPDLSKDDFKYVIESCEVRCSFIHGKYWKRIKRYEVTTEIIFTDSGIENTINIFNLDNEEAPIKEVNDKNDLAVIIFTSGSTGRPKGVMLTHYNLKYNTNSIIKYLELQSSDRVMVVLPFSYCFGTSLLHTHLKVGGQVVINNMFMFPGKVLNEINEKKCTVFAGVPSVYSILLRRSPLKRKKFPTLRLVQQAGGKLTNPFILELKETLPTTKIYIMYGQTEATARLSYLPPDLLVSKLGSIGKGIPGTTVEVLNKEGKPVNPGEIGEVVASGGNIMKGYWKDPDATAKVLKKGKLFTGDIGTVDDEGYIILTDRVKEIIKVGGYRVGPKEIENYISIIEDVVEVAIIGIPDELLGEGIKAFISITQESELTEKDIISYCKKHFPIHKVPKEIEFMSTLPKNTSRKIDKVLLKQQELEKRGED